MLNSGKTLTIFKHVHFFVFSYQRKTCEVTIQMCIALFSFGIVVLNHNVAGLVTGATHCLTCHYWLDQSCRVPIDLPSIKWSHTEVDEYLNI